MTTPKSAPIRTRKRPPVSEAPKMTLIEERQNAEINRLYTERSHLNSRLDTASKVNRHLRDCQKATQHVIDALAHLARVQASTFDSVIEEDCPF